MKKIISFLFLLSFQQASAKELSMNEFIYVENKSSNNPMVMKTKPVKEKRKIDRSTGFFDDLGTVTITDLEDEVVDDTSEEKEINRTVKEISEGLKNDLTSEKLIKVKGDMQLENEALDDVESRYQKLLKIDSTPKEPSDTEDAEISPY